MACSPAQHELGISDDHSGIVAVEAAKPGEDFAQKYKLDDTIIDIENKMFTHRPDLAPWHTRSCPRAGWHSTKSFQKS